MLVINDFQKQISLADYTNYKIGGKAEYFFIAKSQLDLVEAIQVASEHQLAVNIIGGGCNMIVSDKGVKGLVIVNRYQDLVIKDNLVTVSSGYDWHEFVQELVKNSLAGLEATIGIPGSVGGAIIGNAGCFGQEVKDALVSVEIISNGQLKTLSNADMKFAYRESYLKTTNDVIVSAVFKFVKTDQQILQEKIEEVTKLRAKNEDRLPSCGSTFKSLILTSEIEQQLNKSNILISDSIKKYGKVPAKLLIAEADLSGKKIGAMKVSELNPNFIVNLGGGTADEFVQLVSLIKQQVRDRFGLQLEEEVRYLGF